jgi:hypothetical protein
LVVEEPDRERATPQRGQVIATGDDQRALVGPNPGLRDGERLVHARDQLHRDRDLEPRCGVEWDQRALCDRASDLHRIVGIEPGAQIFVPSRGLVEDRMTRGSGRHEIEGMDAAMGDVAQRGCAQGVTEHAFALPSTDAPPLLGHHLGDPKVGALAAGVALELGAAEQLDGQHVRLDRELSDEEAAERLGLGRALAAPSG